MLAAALISSVAFSLAKLHTATMKTLETSKINIEAQQYGLAKAELLRSISYDNVVSQDKSAVKNTNGFTDEVVVGAETDYSDTVKQKICTVNVYKDDESLPRFSYKISKLNTDKGSSNSVPAGTILPWYGEKANIPNGFALCDGTNGTPDLCDRFLVGAGSTYSLGAKGGEATHKLTGEELPSQSVDFAGWYLDGFKHVQKGSNKHSVPHSNSIGNIADAQTGSSRFTPLTMGRFATEKLETTTASDVLGYSYEKLFFNPFSSALKLGNDQPHENRPPYYAVFYIMKL